MLGFLLGNFMKYTVDMSHILWYQNS